MVLSRIGFHSSRCAREVPHLPGPVRRSTSHSASALPTTVPGWPFIPQPALKLTYFSSVTREGSVPDHNMGPLPAGPLPACCATSSGRPPSCLSLFPSLLLILLLWGSPPTECFPAFLKGPALLQTPFCFIIQVGENIIPPFPRLLSPLLSLSTFLSLPPHFSFFLTSLPSFSPYYSFVSSLSSSYCPHNYFPIVVKLIL